MAEAEKFDRPFLLSILELGGRLIFIVVAILYCVGFLVSNIHLARFGYFSLTLFERRYALAGFWAIAPLLFCYMSFWFGRQGEELKSGRPLTGLPGTRGLSPFVRKAIAFTLPVLLFYTFSTTFSTFFGVSFSPWWLPFMYGSGLLSILSARGAYLQWRGISSSPSITLPGGERTPVSARAMAFSVVGKVQWIWTPLWATYLTLFTYVLFPKIPASWGGGAPERVQLLLDPEDAAALASVGLHRLDRELSAPVLLVATTSDDYVVLIDSAKAAFVRRDLVRAVIMEGRFKATIPIRATYRSQHPPDSEGSSP